MNDASRSNETVLQAAAVPLPKPIALLLEMVTQRFPTVSYGIASPVSENANAPHHIDLKVPGNVALAITWDPLFGFVDKESNVRFSTLEEVLEHVAFAFRTFNNPPKTLSVVDPAPGTILSPGDYLIEMGSVDALMTADDLLVALAMLGFGEVRLDESVRAGDEAGQEKWLLDEKTDEPVLGRFRFVARLEEAFQIQQHPFVRWLYVQALNLDPFKKDMRLTVEPYALKRGCLYELHFLSRPPQTLAGEARKRHREVAYNHLVAMAPTEHGGGFEALKLSCLKKHMRYKGQSGADSTMWYAVARWNGPDTNVNSEDVLYFEDVVPVLPPERGEALPAATASSPS